MPPPGKVHVNYPWPAELHHAAKTVAAARGLTLKAFLFESLTMNIARGYDPGRGAGARPR